MTISSISSFFQVNPDKTGIKSLGLSDEEKFKYLKRADSDRAKIADQRAEIIGQTVNNAATANTLWQTQSIAQSSESDAIDVESEDIKIDPQSAEDKFREFMDKSPEELMREAVLKQLGYTEEDLANMTPDERAKVEEEIRQMIETKIEEDMREKGVDIDSANKIVLNATPVLEIA